MADQLPAFSVSQLAQTYHFNCDKLIRLSGQPKASKPSQTAAPSKTNTNANANATKNAFVDAHKRRGDRFEAVLKNRMSLLHDCTDTPANEARNVLRNAEAGQTLYQLRCHVPEEFYKELGVEGSYVLKTFVPDFIIVKSDTEGNTRKKVLFITDAKSSKATNISHQFQVAAYAFLLGYIVRDIRSLEIENMGGIWLPDSPAEPRTFRLDFLLPKIEHFFRFQLPNVLAQPKPRWLFNTKCRGCEYVDMCRQEAYETIGRVPYLSDAKVEGLEEVDLEALQKEKEVEDVEDLGKILENLELEDGEQKRRIKRLLKIRKSTKSSPYLEAYATHKAQFIGSPTASFPTETDDDLFITMSLDPLYLQPFGYAITLYNGNTQTRSYSHSIPKDIMPPILAFTNLMEHFVTSLENTFTHLAATRSRACIFVFSDTEKSLIQASLIRYVSIDIANLGLTNKAMQCLLSLFEGAQLLTTEQALPDLTSALEESQLPRIFPRMVLLEHAVKDNIALGVPGFYRFEDLFEWMVEPMATSSEAEIVPEKHDGYRRDITRLDNSQIYEQWMARSTEKEINDLHVSRNEITQLVLRSFRSLAARYSSATNTPLNAIFLFSPPLFAFSSTRKFKSTSLAKLYFFKQYEAVTSCEQMRQNRFLGLTGEDEDNLGGIRLRFEKYEEIESPVLKKKSLVGRFTLVARGDGSAPPDVLEPTSMSNYILVDDSVEGALQAIRFPDILFRKAFRDFPITTVNIHSIDPENQSIILKGYFARLKPRREATYRLYERYIDFNLDKVLDTLVEIDRVADTSMFLRLLEDPNAWGMQLLEDTTDALRATALNLRDEFGMSPSQKDISAEAIKKRMQIIWGPPGSGKTHFLALFLVWYLTHLRPVDPQRKSKPLFIGLTAYTRAAITNLLDRVALVKSNHPTADFEIIKLVTDISGANGSIDGMVRCKAKDLGKKMQGNAVVVGGTVWDWYKVRQEWKEWDGCDIMIVDEGSQLLVSDAAIAIECVKAEHGRLFVAGDHMQLGPILQNDYPVLPDDQPLLFGSIQQCLMRKANGRVLGNDTFFLRKGHKHDFGPCTIQLKDNWRMNDELNLFFQQIYGTDFIARFPNLKLNYTASGTANVLVNRILDPDHAITLVKLRFLGSHTPSAHHLLQTEAQVVAPIVRAYIKNLPVRTARKPPVFIVTPHHRQRVAVSSQLFPDLNDLVTVNTVEKMQGQEAELVIACFTFLSIKDQVSVDFLLDFHRWNVAVSRARCKVIIVTTEAMLVPKGMDMFRKKTTAEGWGFVWLLERWAKERESVVEWGVQ